MQNFYDVCIFCFKELTEQERKGKGDHIIPEYMYGSICMKDVCISCNNRLGHTADFDAIEDERIISSVFSLDLPELQSKIRDRGSGTIIDADDGTEGQVRFKNGKPWVVPKQATPTRFIADENDAQKHLFNRLRKNCKHGLANDELERILTEEFWPKYSALAPGESVSEPRLGSTLRKATGQIHPQWKITENACKQLVAKIGYETAFLVFDQKRLASLPVLRQLAETAMGESELDLAVLAYPVSRHSPATPPPHNPQYHHQIVVYFAEIVNLIDIYFFGVVGFRLILRGNSRDAYGPIPHSDGDIDMISYLMSFEPGEPRRKYLFVHRLGSDDIEEKESQGIL